MTEYAARVEKVEAVQVSKVGDHPSLFSYAASASKGKTCGVCGKDYATHMCVKLGPGMLNLVCPGNWIVTRQDESVEVITDAVFKERYEEVEI